MLILVRSLFCPVPPITGLWFGSTSTLPLAKIYATAASFGSFKVVATATPLCLDPGRILRFELGRNLTDELPRVFDRMNAGSSTEAERSRFYEQNTK